MPEPEVSHFTKLAAAGQEVIRGNYRAAAQIFDLTREGRCPEDVGELAEIFGFMTVKVEAREHALEKALTEVRRKNAELQEAAELRAEFSKLFTGTIILLCCYVMMVAFLREGLHVNMSPLAWATHALNLGLFVMLGGSMAWFLRSHHYPMNTFGLTWNNWKRSLVESLLVCIPAIGALLLFKALLVRFDPRYQGQPVVEWRNWGPWQMFLIYILVSLAQELSSRGFLQTCIERLLQGKGRTTLAILLGSAEFGVVHLHYSFELCVLAFFGAILFGSLYARHRTIVGITVAHYILGQCIFGPLQLVR
jgi:hypothetical protein